MKLCIICGMPILVVYRRMVCGELCAREQKRRRDRKRYHFLNEEQKKRYFAVVREGRKRRLRYDPNERARKREQTHLHARRNAVAYQLLKQLGIYINPRTMEVRYADSALEARVGGGSTGGPKEPAGIAGVSD